MEQREDSEEKKEVRAKEKWEAKINCELKMSMGILDGILSNSEYTTK